MKNQTTTLLAAIAKMKHLYMNGDEVTKNTSIALSEVIIKNEAGDQLIFQDQEILIVDGSIFTAIDNQGEHAFFKVKFDYSLSTTDSRVTVEKMEPIPVGANPFRHDSMSMGTPLVRDFVVMHPGYDSKESPHPIGWIYLVNTRTGNRVKILIDDNF